MSGITEAGRRAISEIALRYGLSEAAVEAMARAVANGGGGMAQFNIPELGGSGQWMSGGMTMVGDMFDHGLQARVSNLCGELSGAMSREIFFQAPPSPGGGPGGGSGGGANWWPPELGSPAAAGGQNQIRYAYFPAASRVAFDLGDGSAVILFDSGDHQIGGFSQQQSGVGGDPFAGITFSSQFGQYALSSLPRAGGGAEQTPPALPAPDPAAPPEPASEPAPAPIAEAPAPAAPQTPAPAAISQDPREILATIERLAALRDAGALTEEEFTAKKAELLARI